MQKERAKNKNPVIMDTKDGSLWKNGAMLSPIIAPMVKEITGNTYKKKVK